MSEHKHNEDPQGSASQLSGPTQSAGNLHQIAKNQSKRFLRQVEQDAIRFSREEAEAAGRIYGGPYPNLIATSTRITTDPHSTKEFAGRVADSGEPTLGPRIVFFTAGSMHVESYEGGGGITFKRFPSDSPLWNDFAVAIRGITRSQEAEMVAMSHALKLAFSDHHGAKVASNPSGSFPVYIFTHSKESLTKLRTYLATNPCGKSRKTDQYMHPAFINFIEDLDSAVKSGIDVRFHWVKSHAAVEGNERARMLAGTASRWFRERPWPQETEKPYAAFPIPITAINAEPRFVQALRLHSARRSQPLVSTQPTLGKRKRESDEVHSEGEGVETRPKMTARRLRKEQRKITKGLGRLRLPKTSVAQPEPTNAGEVAPDIADGDGSTRVAEDATMEG